MNSLKSSVFSILEAGLFYFICFYLIDKYNINGNAFWFCFIPIGLTFVWLMRQRQFYWINKFDNRWCPENRWYYSDDKNSAIFCRWQGVIQKAESDCKDRMQNLQS